MKPLNEDGMLVQNAVANHNELVEKLSYAQDKMNQEELSYLVEHYEFAVYTGDYELIGVNISGVTHILERDASSGELHIVPLSEKRYGVKWLLDRRWG